MTNTDILLINPPFAMPDKPCISTPVLAGYLKSRGFRVRVLDLNIEFYRDFLSAGHLRRGAAFVNAPGAPLFSLFENKDLPYRRRLELFRDALRLASAPYFPEALNFTCNTGYVRYQSPYSNFSSRDITGVPERATLFSGPLTRLLTAFFKEISPLIVGISVSFPDMIMPAFKCAEIVKSIDPTAHITMGGSFVSVHMREINNPGLFKFVDSFILDDGEIPLERLIKEQSSGHPNLDNVPGIIYLEKEKNEIRGHAPAPPLEMVKSPPPDYTLFPLENYLVKKDSMSLLFRLSRGCYWAKCTFCKTKLPIINHYDQPPADHLYAQLESVVEQTGIRRFHFTDEAASPEVLERISERILERGLAIDWGTNFRINKRLTLERSMLFRKAGCYAVSLGLESYSRRVLRLMKKGVDKSLVRKVLTNLAWAGIDVSLYMIVGFPTETEAEALESFEGIMALKEEGLIKDCVYNVFELTPYSAAAASPADFGISRVPGINGRDLAPPVSRFDSTGMTRERTFELCRSFIEQINRGDV